MLFEVKVLVIFIFYSFVDCSLVFLAFSSTNPEKTFVHFFPLTFKPTVQSLKVLLIILCMLHFWDFHGLTVDNAWSLLEWVVWDHLNLKRLVVFIDIHFPIHVHFTLDLIMLCCGVICVILLPIMLVHVLIIYFMPIQTCLCLQLSARGQRGVNLLVCR